MGRGKPGRWEFPQVEAQAMLTVTRVDREPLVQEPPEVRKQSAFTRLCLSSHKEEAFS